MRRFGAMQAFAGFGGSTATVGGAGDAAPGSSSTEVRCAARRGGGAAVQADRARRYAHVARLLLRACARFVLAACAAGWAIAPVRAEVYDGFLAPSFGDGGRETVLFYSGVVAIGSVVILQPDGKIVVMGTCSIGSQSADARACAVRFLSNGAVDSAFGPNQNGPFLFSDFAGFPASFLRGAVRQSDGRFVLVGSSSDPAHSGSWVARLSASGQLERAPNGEAVRWLNLSSRLTSSYSVVYAIALAPDGKFVVAGSANSEADENNWDMAVARLNADLSLDQSFNPGGALAGVRVAAFDLGGSKIDRAYSVAVQPDGKIVATGAADIALGPVNAAAVLRVNANGTPDANFGNNGRVWFTVNPDVRMETKALAVAFDAQQNVLLVGNGVFLAGAGTNGYVARLRRADGALDTSFGTDGTGLVTIYSDGLGFHKYMADLLVQPDGKIVAVGSSTYTSSSSSFSTTDMERLLPNGLPDTTFSGVFNGFAGDDRSASNAIWKATYDPRGYLVVSGASNGDMGVARLTSEGVFGGHGAGFDR